MGLGRGPATGADVPRRPAPRDHPLPRALDDAAAAKLLRAAQGDRRLLVRVTVEMLLRTGLRVSEYTSLRADAIVHIGAGPWLHVPVGKLREDRYLLPHPHLVALIDDYRSQHVAGQPLLLPRENGEPADRHAITRYINKAGAAAGLPTSTPPSAPLLATGHGHPEEPRRRSPPPGRAARHHRSHPLGQPQHGPALHHSWTHITIITTAVGNRSQGAGQL